MYDSAKQTPLFVRTLAQAMNQRFREGQIDSHTLTEWDSRNQHILSISSCVFVPFATQNKEANVRDMPEIQWQLQKSKIHLLQHTSYACRIK